MFVVDRILFDGGHSDDSEAKLRVSFVCCSTDGCTFAASNLGEPRNSFLGESFVHQTMVFVSQKIMTILLILENFIYKMHFWCSIGPKKANSEFLVLVESLVDEEFTQK